MTEIGYREWRLLRDAVLSPPAGRHASEFEKHRGRSCGLRPRDLLVGFVSELAGSVGHVRTKVENLNLEAKLETNLETPADRETITSQDQRVDITTHGRCPVQNLGITPLCLLMKTPVK